VDTDPSVEELLEKNQQGVLFYIAEEAVNNARKHAQAEHIWVRLKANHDTLLLDIQDDGVGFNLGDVEDNYDRRGSLGMVNMRERADMLSGTVRIDSAEGKGTRITVFVPLNHMG
jgi:signal transduction histidine kinase